ncbi:TRAP transporter permease [Natronorarus salvus]|uniref:TRAP transporter permease n=1 Tax=Natronorarus salvus TaxID=3117733 RepID=UPI002F265F14
MTAETEKIDSELLERPIVTVLREKLAAENVKRHVTLWSVLALLTVPLWLYVIAYARYQLIARAQFGAVFLGGILLLYILHEMAQSVGGGNRYIGEDLRALVAPGNRLDTLVLVVCAVIVTVTTVYIWSNFEALYTDRRGFALDHEYVLAVAFTLVIIYLTWRAFGMTFLVVVLAGIGYALFGSWVPGTLGHTGLSYERVLRILVIGVRGFYGFLTQLVAAWIALFLLYAGLLKAYGAFDLILRMAVRSAKYIDSGVAQTAVVASAVIGSVNGSQTANAGMTGSFTIPMMKENGIKPETAAGIESVASTSGQVLPPVMGAGAFIMASLITGITYADVLVAGLIPAAILVIAIVVAVHYAAGPQIENQDLSEFFDDALTRGELVLEGIKYGVPLAVLIYILGIVQWTVMTAALWTAVSMMALGIGIPVAKVAFDTGNARAVFWRFAGTIRETWDGWREGVVVLAPVAIILAAINGVVDLLMATGVPTAISLTLMDLSGGVLIFAAIMAMIICILLGLGMPTTAAYTVVALLIAPTLINQFFLPEFSAHFFVFYAAILAGLTPPIATCVAVACGIAGSNFWRSCLEAIKISAPLFVLPFTFIYHPEIVSGEITSAGLLTGLITLVGAIAIIHGLNYRFSFGRPGTYGMRLGFFALGTVIMVHESLTIRMGALGIVVVLYLTQASVGKPAPIEKLRGLAAGINGRRK